MTVQTTRIAKEFPEMLAACMTIIEQNVNDDDTCNLVYNYTVLLAYIALKKLGKVTDVEFQTELGLKP